MTSTTNPAPPAVEWQTIFICVLCYGGFGLSTVYADQVGLVASFGVLLLALTLFSSFSHEVLHGHPFRANWANTALVFPALGLLVPYHRFRDTHLEHHHDPSLTDPYDDPESNYIDPLVWAAWPASRQRIYLWNNTLLGRMIVGPAIGLATFYKSDWALLVAKDKSVMRAYLFHFLGLLPVIWWLAHMATMPVWLYALAVYTSHSLLRIRTFLEHQAHEKARCRSVIIEDKGILSFLFLKNNLHAVHHACPTQPWYRLQEIYAARKDDVLRRNGGYVYTSYAQIFRLHLFRTKDPVPHRVSVPASAFSDARPVNHRQNAQTVLKRTINPGD